MQLTRQAAFGFEAVIALKLFGTHIRRNATL